VIHAFRSFMALLSLRVLAGTARAQPAPAPVAYAGRGALFGADRQKLPAGPAELAKLQPATLARLLEGAEPAQRGLLNQRLAVMRLPGPSNASQGHGGRRKDRQAPSSPWAAWKPMCIPSRAAARAGCVSRCRATPRVPPASARWASSARATMRARAQRLNTMFMPGFRSAASM
jgi:hypothetical protein